VPRTGEHVVTRCGRSRGRAPDLQFLVYASFAHLRNRTGNMLRMLRARSGGTFCPNLSHFPRPALYRGPSSPFQRSDDGRGGAGVGGVRFDPGCNMIRRLDQNATLKEAPSRTSNLWLFASAARAALYSAGALAGSAIDSCGCAAAVCGGAGAGPAAPVCTGRTPGSLWKAAHCSFVP
jgi:hypothetical protein